LGRGSTLYFTGLYQINHPPIFVGYQPNLGLDLGSPGSRVKLSCRVLNKWFVWLSKFITWVIGLLFNSSWLAHFLKRKCMFTSLLIFYHLIKIKSAYSTCRDYKLVLFFYFFCPFIILIFVFNWTIRLKNYSFSLIYFFILIFTFILLIVLFF